MENELKPNAASDAGYTPQRSMTATESAVAAKLNAEADAKCDHATVQRRDLFGFGVWLCAGCGRPFEPMSAEKEIA